MARLATPTMNPIGTGYAMSSAFAASTVSNEKLGDELLGTLNLIISSRNQLILKRYWTIETWFTPAALAI